MKYKLPDNLKTYRFLCKNKFKYVSLKICKMNCPDNYRQCWENHLRADLTEDCAVLNERKATSYVICSKCGKICDIGLTDNRFLCKCGNEEGCSEKKQKKLMGDAFEEIDEQELNEVLRTIK